MHSVHYGWLLSECEMAERKRSYLLIYFPTGSSHSTLHNSLHKEAGGGERIRVKLGCVIIARRLQWPHRVSHIRDPAVTLLAVGDGDVSGGVQRCRRSLSLTAASARALFIARATGGVGGWNWRRATSATYDRRHFQEGQKTLKEI